MGNKNNDFNKGMKATIQCLNDTHFFYDTTGLMPLTKSFSNGMKTARKIAQKAIQRAINDRNK